MRRLHVRRADAADLHDLWLWRNDLLTREMSISREPVPFDEHSAWFTHALQNPNRVIYIGELDGLKVGMIRFDHGNASIEVSISLSPSARGRGLAAPLLAASIDKLGRCELPLTATIRKDNHPSIKCFSACGFERVNEDGQFYCYRRAGA